MKPSNGTARGMWLGARLGVRLAAAAVLCVATMQAQAAATITIINGNTGTSGFNDPKPVAPLPGNPATTLGQQRLNALQYAVDLWGATLTSSQAITVLASFDVLSCPLGSAVLASTTPVEYFANFNGAPRQNALYPTALANKLAGTDLRLDATKADIRVRFNAGVGTTNCLSGTPFYLGTDNNHGAGIDFVEIALHELAHGLGFINSTDGSTGKQMLVFDTPTPSIWDYYLLDTATGKSWSAMTDAERVASGVNTSRLVWNGTAVSNALTSVLNAGTPRLNISGPAAGTATGDYVVGTATFGAQLAPTTPAVESQLMPVVDQPDGKGYACVTLSASNALAVKGNIALVDRGGDCDFTTKATVVQAAGARGLVIADNAAGTPPPPLGGFDPNGALTIPVVRISQADGIALKAKLTRRTRTASGVVANLGVNLAQYAGADAGNRALLYAPNPYQGGSSISHFDFSASPNQLMEPAIGSDVKLPADLSSDLTFKLLQDIGW